MVQFQAQLARALMALAVSMAAIACSNDAVVVLGHAEPTPYRFGMPRVLKELSIEGRADNPSLTSDLLEIYFTAGATLTTPLDVWTATRESRADAFGTPQPVTEVNTPGVETSPVVSGDGLTLW